MSTPQGQRKVGTAPPASKISAQMEFRHWMESLVNSTAERAISAEQTGDENKALFLKGMMRGIGFCMESFQEMMIIEQTEEEEASKKQSKAQVYFS